MAARYAGPSVAMSTRGGALTPALASRRFAPLTHAIELCACETPATHGDRPPGLRLRSIRGCCGRGNRGWQSRVAIAGGATCRRMRVLSEYAKKARQLHINSCLNIYYATLAPKQEGPRKNRAKCDRHGKKVNICSRAKGFPCLVRANLSRLGAPNLRGPKLLDCN